MRDPKRIPKIINQLTALWASSPDMRLGQLILNAAKYDYKYYRHGDTPKEMEFNDIYNVEDEELIKRICEYMKKEG